MKTRWALCALALLAAACGDDGGGDAASTTDGGESGGTVRLLTHESFNVSDDVLAAFTEETGYEVEIVAGGDAGSVVNQAILSAGNPQGDVLYGIDTTFLSVGLDEGLFEPYESPALDAVPDELEIDDEHRVTPIDLGDVCLNYDRAFFEAPGAPPVPTSLDELTDPAYRDLLVVQDPATSSPGLAFLAATVETFGDDGWEAFWEGLRANGVRVAADWTDAYYAQFSGGGGSEGDRPLVVSYASSPPAEVVFADPPVDEPPTGVIEASCIRQVEYAGVLAGADDPEGARALVDFLLSERFQADMPLNMYVFLVREGTALPDVFERFAATPEDVIEVDPFELGERRDELIGRWRDIVVR
jgi:thiamine transport system substrate-binding protein